MRHRIIDSPIGPLTLVIDEAEALAAVVTAGQQHAPTDTEIGARDDSCAAQAAEQLDAYFDGRLTQFELMTAPGGTDFQRRVWAEIACIPFGETRSYGEVAAALGEPNATRAVGAATARNPLLVVVPCHRLVGSSGALTGYAGGLARKQWLLAHERS